MSDSMDYEPGEREVVFAQNSALYPAIFSVEIDGKPFIFLLPRKCASNTIKDYLRQLEATRNLYLHPFEITATPTIPKIAVVRHPVDRLISAWKHGTQSDNIGNQMPGMFPWMSWDLFCKLVCEEWNDAMCNPHFRSYSFELQEYSDLLRCESLDSDWFHLSNKYHWRGVELKKLNKTKQLPVEVSRQQLEALAVRYQIDAANFDYDILSWENPT